MIFYSNIMDYNGFDREIIHEIYNFFQTVNSTPVQSSRNF